ncbi:MAG: sigma-70 family RNA polymerase sigma factor [Rhodothermia bacterium]|nr:sigma-70 family RNA polymerase sigma factor [Rhodothermia bacterium]
MASKSLENARNGSAEAEVELAVWTYRQLRCVVDSLIDKDHNARVCDADAVLSIALIRVEAGRDSVQDPGSYASWVSVVGRNAYLNYKRSRPAVRRVKEADLSYDAERQMESRMDGARVRRSVEDAISRLPAFLRVVATMRLVEDQDYECISVATGKSKPTVRAYMNKALERLRTDDLLRCLLEEAR